MIRLFTHLIIFLRMHHSLRCYLFNGSHQLLISVGLNLTQWPTHGSQVCGTDPRALHPFPPPSSLGGYGNSTCSHDEHIRRKVYVHVRPEAEMSVRFTFILLWNQIFFPLTQVVTTIISWGYFCRCDAIFSESALTSTAVLLVTV